MSNLVKAIAATDTGERRVVPVKSKLFQDVFSMREDFSDLNYEQVAKVYRIGVTLGSTCMVTEIESMKNHLALGHAIRRTKEQVIEAVFGEFRQDFRMIEKLLYDYDFEGAATALRAMERKMYSTEEELTPADRDFAETMKHLQDKVGWLEYENRNLKSENKKLKGN